MSVGRWARLVATIVMVAAVVTMVHGSEAPKFGFDALGLRKASPVVDPFLIDLQERTFRFFWDTANPKNGLVPDRYPTPSFSSIAAVGFALTAYPIGVERGYVTREAARQRVLTTLRFFAQRAAGSAAARRRRLQGLLLSLPRHEDRRALRRQRAVHRRHRASCSPARCSASRTSTARTRRKSKSARSSTRSTAASTGRGRSRSAPAISLGWSPEDGFLDYDWRGYNEAMLVYLLALGSPTHPVGPEAWTEWTSTYDADWGKHVRPGVPGLRPAVRPPVHARLDRLPRHPGRLHAPARPRLLREHAPRDLRAAGLRDRQSAACKDYGATIWGTDRERRAGGHRSSRSPAACGCYPQLRRARRRRRAARTTTARSRRPRRSRRFRSRRSSRFPPCSRCTSASASTSTRSTASSTRSI